MNSPIVEWWFDDAAFHADRATLLLARLRVLNDGCTEVSIEDKQYQFASVEGARSWLTEDEFLRLSDLFEEYGLNVKAPTV